MSFIYAVWGLMQARRLWIVVLSDNLGVSTVSESYRVWHTKSSASSIKDALQKKNCDYFLTFFSPEASFLRPITHIIGVIGTSYLGAIRLK